MTKSSAQEQARKAFADAHRGLWAALKQTGAQPYNFLHHPLRHSLIEGVSTGLQAVIDAAEAFDASLDNSGAEDTEITDLSSDWKAVIDAAKAFDTSLYNSGADVTADKPKSKSKSKRKTKTTAPDTEITDGSSD